jgi:hypothetical protein
LFWPAKASPAVEVRGEDSPPILILGETLDGVTPIEGNLEVRRRFPHATFVATQGGTTHGNSLAGNACVDEPIFDYLRNGAVPTRQKGDDPDVLCDPLPLPEPTPATYARRSDWLHATTQHPRHRLLSANRSSTSP